MQKAVLKLDMHDEKDKENAIEMVSGIGGVDSIDMNMEENKLTVTGAVDPAEHVMKLRELVSTDIISVGSAKEAQKDDNRSNKNEQSKDSTFVLVKSYIPPPLYHYGRYVTAEYPDYFSDENPNACVIC